MVVVPLDTAAKILLSIDFTSPNFDSMFVILVFRFEILRALEIFLDGRDEVVGAELGGFDRDEQGAPARTFVDFSKDSAIREATYSEVFSCDPESAHFHFQTDEFRAIDPPRTPAADAPESISGIDSSSSSNTIAL